MDTLQTNNVLTRKEYIKREEAIAYAPLPKDLREYRTMNLDDAWEDGYDFALGQLKALPAADVAPVRHGRWIKVDDGIYYHMECSLCHERPLRNRWVDDNELSPYCHNCGADMREVEHD